MSGQSATRRALPPGARELTATEREIERLHREHGMSESAIALELAIPRSLVWRTLDLPVSAFRTPLPPDLEKETRERAARAEAYKRRPKTRFNYDRSRGLYGSGLDPNKQLATATERGFS